MKRYFLGAIGALVVVIVFGTPSLVSAHRSGCHRWHSCPSDSGIYSCGDLGYPCIYPSTPTYYAPETISSSVDPVITDYTDPKSPTGYEIFNHSKTQRVSANTNNYYNYKSPTIIWSGASDNVRIAGYYYAVSRDTSTDPESVGYYSSSEVWEVPPEYFTERGEYYIHAKAVDANSNKSGVVYATYRYDPSGVSLTDYDNKLTKRLGGRFLITANTGDELWYVSPNKNRRYRFDTPKSLSLLIKKLSSNISNQDFKLLQQLGYKNKMFKTLMGRFIRKPSGQIWYIDPVSKKLFRIKDEKNGYTLFTKLGLKISSANIEKIRTGIIQ